MTYVENEQLDLNTLHKRAGGTSETTCSLNDTDIRALRHTATGGNATESSFDQFGDSPVYTFTVTAAAGGTDNLTKGYNDDGSFILGSISPDPPVVDDIYTGWKIETIAKLDGLSTEPIYLVLKKFIQGDAASNSGWEHLVIGDTSFYREEADAYGVVDNGLEMVWQWFTDPSGAAATLGANPFNMSGNTTIKIA